MEKIIKTLKKGILYNFNHDPIQAFPGTNPHVVFDWAMKISMIKCMFGLTTIERECVKIYKINYISLLNNFNF